MRQFYFLFALGLLVSCGSKTTSHNDQEDSAEISQDTALIESDIDTIAIEQVNFSNEVAELLPFFLDTLSLPLDIDSNYIQSRGEHKGKQLEYKQLSILAANGMVNSVALDNQYIIETAIRIDSLKSVNQYDDYVANIDIGMIQEAGSYAQAILQISETRQILLWQMDFSTYEACPYASGDIVFGTLIENGELKNTIELAEVSGGGDPPVWNDTYINARITEDMVEQYVYYSYGESVDEGEDIIETNEQEYKIEIKENGFKELE